MASAPPAQQTFKPAMTFAKVAASSYKPQNMPQSNPTTNTTSNEIKPAHASPAAQNAKDGTVKPVGKNGAAGAQPIVVMPKRSLLEKDSSIGQGAQPSALAAGETRQVETSTKDIPTDDNSTQVSSSGGSAKLANADKQSVASGTTAFALDEKASLRPDDSVSTKAIDEEDVFTGPAGSRVGSDTEARAFSDQLHQIAVMAPRGVPTTVMRPNISFGEVPMNIVSPQPQVLPENGVPAVMLPTVSEPVPDEKLLEAIFSERDRVFVLKLEQDVLDFLKNDREPQLQLPDSNGFYRMLAHKVADYYGLEHAVQGSGSGPGLSVLITKTAFSRFPTPLSAISPPPSTRASTPPPAAPARKIMRRGDEKASGSSTNVNSEGASKANSEDGSDPGRGTPNGSKSKAALTREEREAKYTAARLRIFGEEAEVAEASKEAADADVSRTSSAAGKKKTKKQRNDSNDDFEPRSQFPGYYPNQFAGNGYPSEAYFYPQYTGMAATQPQFNVPQNGASPPVMYPNGFQQVDTQGQYAFMSPQGYPVSPNGPVAPGYGPAPANYDLSSHFQQSMQFPNSSPAGQMPPLAPKPHSPNYQGQYQGQPQQLPAQPQMLPYESYPYGQPGFMPMYPPERPVSSPGQMPPANSSYPYGQLPNTGYPNGRPSKHQHPVPGSYKGGQQFNPQTQAFVPGGGRPGHMMPQQGAPMYGGYASVPSHMQSMQNMQNMQNMQARSTPSTSNPSTYNSPRGQPATMAAQNNGNTSNPGSGHMPYGNNSYSSSPSAPPQPSNGNANGNAGILPAHPTPNQQQQTPQQLTHPLPQPPHPASSIAKWGVPSHLPPKPPPPQDQHPQKFLEINRGLPPHTQIPGLPRSVFVPGNGPANGSGAQGGK